VVKQHWVVHTPVQACYTNSVNAKQTNSYYHNL